MVIRGWSAVFCIALFSLTFAWKDGEGILNVHVVPHSHNDPGWWRTFEGYYLDWTKGILNSVVEILNEDKERTFIWAEISYFQRWWQDASETQKTTVKRLIKDGQLEFVTAGWVMNDEANTHIVDIINQLTEGHEWLYKTLSTKPKIGWAIDPFGHSPTMAYVLSQMKFDAMVINRAHRALKDDFRDKQHLEFIWSGDNLNSSASFRILAHMFPWKLYDIPNTCGPNRDVCATFDPENPNAVLVTENNVRERSELLVKLYKEKARLFRHNTLLMPLGDDFKYKTADMTRHIMKQYEMLFKYINEADLGVNIKFSTLSEYFAELPAHEFNIENPDDGVPGYSKDKFFPTYQGDFFTYCDEGSDYWSGYFTTRPFMKGLTRSTQAILRTGEVLATLARMHAGEVPETQWKQWFTAIETARRNVALFQHHDGVTGTARRAVVQDYASRLLSSLAKVAEYSSDMTLVILSRSQGDKSKNDKFSSAERLTWTTEPAPENQLSHGTPHILSVGNHQVAVVVVFNSLAQPRTEVVSVLVNNHEVRVTDSDGQDVTAQVDPVWEEGVDSKLSSSQFTLHFVAKMSGLGLATYFIHSSKGHGSAILSNVVEYSSKRSSTQIKEGWELDVKSIDADTPIRIENSQYKIMLTGLGNIKTIARRTDNTVIEAEQKFLWYSSYRSGAYLFLPNGEAQPIPSSTTSVRVATGPIVVTVQSIADSAVKEHTVRLYDCVEGENSASYDCPQSKGIEIIHTIDLTDGNKEIITRFNTNISNGGHFYTDSNGFDMRERVLSDQLPLQGNYYPITASTYIEARDSAKSARLTVLSHQAHGVSSLKEGELEIMLERRLNQDDGRGLGEPVTDIVRTRIPLWLVMEGFTGAALPFAHPSLTPVASQLWEIYNYPLHTMHSSMETPKTSSMHEEWAVNHLLSIDPLSSLALELGLFTFAPRNIESNDIILRIYYPPTASLNVEKAGQLPMLDFNIDNIFKHFSVVTAKETSLSLLYDKSVVDPSTVVSIRPTEIKTFVIRLAASPVGKSDNKAGEEANANHAGVTENIKNEPIIAGDNNHLVPTKAAPPVPPKDADPFTSQVLEDDTEIIPVNVEKERKGQGDNPLQPGIGDKANDKQIERAGGAGKAEPRKRLDTGPEAYNKHPPGSTYSLYQMSVLFYLGVLVIVVGGALLCRRSRSRASSAFPAPSRVPSIWKEREESMMKLL